MVLTHICHQKLAKLLNLQRGEGSNFSELPDVTRHNFSSKLSHDLVGLTPSSTNGPGGVERKEPRPINIKNLSQMLNVWPIYQHLP